MLRLLDNVVPFIINTIMLFTLQFLITLSEGNISMYNLIPLLLAALTGVLLSVLSEKLKENRDITEIEKDNDRLVKEILLLRSRELNSNDSDKLGILIKSLRTSEQSANLEPKDVARLVHVEHPDIPMDEALKAINKLEHGQFDHIKLTTTLAILNTLLKNRK